MTLLIGADAAGVLCRAAAADLWLARPLLLMMPGGLQASCCLLLVQAEAVGQSTGMLSGLSCAARQPVRDDWPAVLLWVTCTTCLLLLSQSLLVLLCFWLGGLTS